MISRRELILCSVVACSLPSAGVAQRRLPRVGFVLNSAPLATLQGNEPEQTVMRGFMHGLRALGYVEGKNILIERRTAEGKLERLEQIIRGLTELPVDVLVVTGATMTRVAKKVTSTVPIVMTGTGADAVPDIVESYARPGGNITGLEPTFGPEVPMKRLEQIKEMLPRARRIAYLGVATNWNRMKSERAAAAAMGLSFYLVEVSLPDLEGALRRIEQDRPDALLVPTSAELFIHLNSIAQFARKNSLPDFYSFHQAVEAGGLASYGHDPYDIFRRAAGYVDRILKGAQPATLPIEQMSRLELVINLKTARLLGLAVPPSMLHRADRLIE